MHLPAPPETSGTGFPTSHYWMQAPGNPEDYSEGSCHDDVHVYITTIHAV